MKNVAAIILAAGEGTRIKARRKNKVAYKLAGKPMIRYTVETLEKAGIDKIIVVVKFAEKSVKEALMGKKVIYARQGDKKGTAPALESGLEVIAPEINQVLVMYGDDSAFYPVELFHFIITEHQKHQSDVTLLSIKVANPTGLGRILRDEDGNPLGIVEEKVATEEQRKIKEINTGCYCFRRDFIEKRIGEIKINPISQEYYLTDIVEVGLGHGDKVHVCLYPDNSIWHGINDRSQWAKAMRKKKYGEKEEIRGEGKEGPEG
jgi:bifunctional UDP-N-acetylglucosamine pyrophosphorylase/glucosamine-1-phosphate N-acetyltransferase